MNEAVVKDQNFEEGPITLLNARSASVLITDARGTESMDETDTKCPNSDCSDTI